MTTTSTSQNGQQAATPDPKRHHIQPTIPITATETIRKRLDLSIKDFSKALGYSSGTTYAAMLAKGTIPKVAALAAEALMRRQAPGQEPVYLLRTIKGIPQVTLLDRCEEIQWNGKSFLPVPA